MTMTTAPNANSVGSVSPGTSSRLQLPVVSGSLQIRAPSADTRLDEPRSPHDLGPSDRSDDDNELSPQSASALHARGGPAPGPDPGFDSAVAGPPDAASVKRGAWSPQEDEQLVHLVETMRPLKWVHVSAYMRTRTSKQCRERYHNYLKPSLNRAPISKEEGRKIEELVAIHGKRWAEISRQLPGRSDNAIKNWWNASVTRRRASQDTSSVLVQPQPQQTQPQQTQQQQSQSQSQQQQVLSQSQSQPQAAVSQHQLPLPSTSQSHISDASEASSRASSSPPAPPPVSIVFNKQYMDPTCRSPVTPASQSRGGPQRTRSVTNTANLPYPVTTPRWADSRPRMSVGSIPGSRSNSVVEDTGRSVSPNASPPSMPLASSRAGVPDDAPMPGFWNRRVPDYRRPSDALRGDVTSLSQYSLSTSSNPNSRRSSLNPVVPAELARPHGQPAYEQPPHHIQPPSLQQVLQAPLVQLQPASNSIQVQNAFSGSNSPADRPASAERSEHSQEPQGPRQETQPSAQQGGPAEARQNQQTQASSAAASRAAPDAAGPDRSPQPQNKRSSLARLSIANLTNPTPP